MGSIIKAVVFVALMASPNFATGQRSDHRKAAGDLQMHFNNNEFEQIYQAFSPRMKKAHTRQYYLNFLSKVKRDYGKLTDLHLSDYYEKSGDARGIYDGSFEKGNLTVRLSNNTNSEITGLFFSKDKNIL